MKWILGLTVTALGVGLTACGSGGASTSQAGGVGGKQAPTAATATATSTSTVGVAQNPAQGAILVDGQGRTLYLFEKDDGTTSACTGPCAQLWPALTAAAQPAGGSGVDASKLSTADGQVPHQVAYAGHLLYSYRGDAAPGDVKGVGIPGWYPVSPSGAKVDKDDDNSGNSSGNLGY